MGYKFLFEIKDKFPDVDWNYFKPSVVELFCAFPICHTFDENIFIVHGGVPMANEIAAVPQSPMSYSDQKPVIPKGATPYPLGDLQQAFPNRYETYLLEDTPKYKNILWHSFLWSYDRMPYCAEFLEFNQLKTMVCSHTATPYHFITTFLPTEGVEKYSI